MGKNFFKFDFQYTIHREIKKDNAIFYLTGRLNKFKEPLIIEVRNEKGELVYFSDKRFKDKLEIYC